MAAYGIKEVTSAKTVIKQFGNGLYDQVTSETKTLVNKVDDAFFGSEQAEGIKTYITKVNEAVGNLLKNMEYWETALDKVLEEVYKKQNTQIGQQMSDAAGSINVGSGSQG